jgi:8-oxo-dGTP diphosphatase
MYEDKQLERLFWLNYVEIINNLKTLEYKKQETYLTLRNTYTLNQTLRHNSNVDFLSNAFFVLLTPLRIFLQLFISKKDDSNLRQIQAAIVESVLIKIKNIIQNFEIINNDEFERSVEEIIFMLLFYIDEFGRDIKVTAREIKKSVRVDPARNQVERLDELVRDKGHDYNSGGVSTLSYFIWRERSILHEIHKRAQRLLSLSKVLDGAKFEEAPSSAFDLCAFSIFLLAYSQTVPRTKNPQPNQYLSHYQLATLCYLKKDGQTLLIRKSHKNKPDLHYLYNAPGGKLEKGETPHDCILREVYEETGFVPKNLQLKGIVLVSGAAIPDYDIQDWYIFVYMASEWDGELLPSSDEGIPIWVDDNDVQSYMTNKGDKYLLECLKVPEMFEGRILYENREIIKAEFKYYKC